MTATTRRADPGGEALEFEFGDLYQELDAMNRLSQGLVERESSLRLAQFKAALETFQASRRVESWRWAIGRDAPIRTIVSAGEYEPNGRGGHQLQAELSAVWELQLVADRRGRRNAPRRFALVGLASTRVALVEVSVEPSEFGTWRMEIGTADHPGCHFHTQVLGEVAEPPFPASLPVPRFPALVPTPMMVLEFVLGELFQDRWREVVSRDREELRRCRAVHQRWLLSALDWQRRALERNGGSAWMTLKQLRPEPRMFVGP